MCFKRYFVFCYLTLSIMFGYSQTVKKSETSINSNKHRVLVAAHRGGFDSDLPENSLALFDYTCKNTELKPVILELDIRASNSGTLYLMHDETLDRTTSGKGRISESSDEYLKSLFLKDKNNQLTSHKIPLLSQVLFEFDDSDFMLMLDVKGNIHEEVIDLIKSSGLEDHCIMLTFDYEMTKLCLAASSKMWISTYLSSKEDWTKIKSSDIPNKQMIVYFDKNLDEAILSEINQPDVLLMTDLSEVQNNNGEPFPFGIYCNLLKNKNPGILITDFPVFVARMIMDAHENKYNCENE